MTNDTNKDDAEFKYLIVNETDRRFGLWVNTVGFEAIAPDSPYPLKEHPSGYFFNAEKGRVLHEYQLIYITKGCGQSPRRVSADDMYAADGSCLSFRAGGTPIVPTATWVGTSITSVSKDL